MAGKQAWFATPTMVSYEDTANPWYAVNTTGQLKVDQIPTQPNEVLRLSDLGESESTFTLTGVGFSTVVTVIGRYKKQNKKVSLYIPQVTGISNSTAFALAGLPAAIYPTYQSYFVFAGVDALKLALFGTGHLDVGSDTIVLTPTPGITAINSWAASGTKTLQALFIQYFL